MNVARWIDRLTYAVLIASGIYSGAHLALWLSQ